VSEKLRQLCLRDEEGKCSKGFNFVAWALPTHSPGATADGIRQHIPGDGAMLPFKRQTAGFVQHF
jgi:hypothetical protein